MSRSRKCPTPDKVFYRTRDRAQKVVDELKRRRVYGDESLGVYGCGKHWHIGHSRSKE